jgi:hypothetical protein
MDIGAISSASQDGTITVSITHISFPLCSHLGVRSYTCSTLIINTLLHEFTASWGPACFGHCWQQFSVRGSHDHCKHYTYQLPLFVHF